MFEYKKATQALNYFAIKAEEDGVVLHKTNALKLLYFADKKHLIESTIRTITGDSYKAQSMGPVASHTFDIIEIIAQGREGENEGNDVQYVKEYLDIEYDKSIPRRQNASQSISITSRQGLDTKALSKSDMVALEEVWNIFGDMVDDGDKLWQETHKYPEGNQFEDLDRSQQSIPTRDLMSSAMEGKDLLIDMNDKELSDRRGLYEERRIPHNAISGGS